ncbi:hypothetical protein, partial [Polymorphobacter multimanifer]
MQDAPHPVIAAPHPADSPAYRKATLAGLVAAVRARWLWVVVAAVLALVAAVLWLRGAEYRHHVELRVAASPGSSGRST